MSMHIKSPSGTPDIPIGSVRIKTDPIEVPIESGGYRGAGVGNEGQVIGPDTTEFLASIRCRGMYIPYLPAGTYLISPSQTADNDICFALTVASLSKTEDTDIADYCLKNADGGGWNPAGAVTVTLSTPGYLVITIKKLENENTITPTKAGSNIIISQSEV